MAIVEIESQKHQAGHSCLTCRNFPYSREFEITPRTARIGPRHNRGAKRDRALGPRLVALPQSGDPVGVAPAVVGRGRRLVHAAEYPPGARAGGGVALGTPWQCLAIREPSSPQRIRRPCTRSHSPAAAHCPRRAGLTSGSRMLTRCRAVSQTTLAALFVEVAGACFCSRSSFSTCSAPSCSSSRMSSRNTTSGRSLSSARASAS